MAIYSLPSTTTSVSLYHLTPFRIIWLLQALPSPTLKPSNFTTAFTYIISRFLIYKQLWLCSKLSTLSTYTWTLNSLNTSPVSTSATHWRDQTCNLIITNSCTISNTSVLPPHPLFEYIYLYYFLTIHHHCLVSLAIINTPLTTHSQFLCPYFTQKYSIGLLVRMLFVTGGTILPTRTKTKLFLFLIIWKSERPEHLNSEVQTCSTGSACPTLGSISFPVIIISRQVWWIPNNRLK